MSVFLSKRERLDQLMRGNEALAGSVDRTVGAFMEFSSKIDAEIRIRAESDEYKAVMAGFMNDDVVQRLDDEGYSAAFNEAFLSVVSADLVLEMQEYGLDDGEAQTDGDYTHKSVSQILLDIIEFLPTADPDEVLFSFFRLSQMEWFHLSDEAARLYVSALIQFRIVAQGHQPDIHNQRVGYLTQFSPREIVTLIGLDAGAVDFIYSRDDDIDPDSDDMDYLDFE